MSQESRVARASKAFERSRFIDTKVELRPLKHIAILTWSLICTHIEDGPDSACRRHELYDSEAQRSCCGDLNNTSVQGK